MAKPNFARTERTALADLLVALGPDQPTLCEGWDTRDLAAHLVARDRRPDSAVGAIFTPLAGHTDRVRSAVAARPWELLIEQLRNPPQLSLAGIPTLDRLVNTSEFFIHHEDIRRAQPVWTPRPLDPGLADVLHRQVALMTKMALRRFPAKITVIMPGYAKPVTAGSGGPALDVSGDPGELTLMLSGRQSSAKVNIVGPDDLVNRLKSVKLGF